MNRTSTHLQEVSYKGPEMVFQYLTITKSMLLNLLADYQTNQNEQNIPARIKGKERNASQKPECGNSKNVKMKRSHSSVCKDQNLKTDSSKQVHAVQNQPKETIFKNAHCVPEKKTIPKTKETIQHCSEPENNTTLHVAIVNKNQSPFTPEQVDLIKTKLMSAMNDNLYTETPPQFEKVDFYDGYLFFECANQKARTWLEKTAASMMGLWNGADLIVENQRALKRATLMVTIQNVTCTTCELLKRLKYQNPELSITNWCIVSCFKRNETVTLKVCVDLKSYQYLKSKQFKIYYQFEMLEFSVIKGVEI